MNAALLLLQAFGFLVQALPIACLCFVPFHENEFRISPKRTMLLVFIGLFILSVGFSAIMGAIYTPSGQHNQIMRMTADIYMAGSLILGALFYLWNVRTRLLQKILVLVLLVHYAAILFTLSSVLVGQFTPNLQTSHEVLIIYGHYNSWINPLLLAVTGPIVYIFLKRVVRISLPETNHPTLKRGCIYLLISLLLYCICVYMLTSTNFAYGLHGISILLFLLAFILTDAIVYYIFFAEVKLTAQNRQLENQLRSFDEQYKQIALSIEDARRARHDVRHHLNMISVLNQKGQTEELAAYLERYNAVYRDLEEKPLCGYPAVDTILKYYIQLAKEEEINVETDFSVLQENMDFDVMDMTVMLGNIMENAIESCRRISSNSQRFIRIQIHKINVSLLIQVENSCQSDDLSHLGFTDGSNFISTKGPLRHGQGLKSIRLITEKYGGSAEYKLENYVFTTRIVLNIP